MKEKIENKTYHSGIANPTDEAKRSPVERVVMCAACRKEFPRGEISAVTGDTIGGPLTLNICKICNPKSVTGYVNPNEWD